MASANTNEPFLGN